MPARMAVKHVMNRQTYSPPAPSSQLALVLMMMRRWRQRRGAHKNRAKFACSTGRIGGGPSGGDRTAAWWGDWWGNLTGCDDMGLLSLSFSSSLPPSVVQVSSVFFTVFSSLSFVSEAPLFPLPTHFTTLLQLQLLSIDISRESARACLPQGASRPATWSHVEDSGLFVSWPAA